MTFISNWLNALRICSIVLIIFVKSVPVYSQISGTPNYLPKFLTSTSIGPSVMYEGSTNIGIGTTTPTYKLDVNGGIRGTSSANLDISAFGSASTIYARSSYYNRTNNFGALPVVNDVAYGASIGYVDNFTAGWSALTPLNRSTGFSPGSYDIYVRIRTNASGNSPTSCIFGLYNYTTATYPIQSTLTSLSNSYQEVYAGRFSVTTASLAQNLTTFFSTSGVTTNYYLDYVKFVPSPLFAGGNVLIGTSNNITADVADKLQVAGNIYARDKILVNTLGQNTGTHSLAVNGSAIFTKAIVKLTTAPWPDYVFSPDYKLMRLDELEAHLKISRHLPGVISAKEVEENGIDLGENQAILLKKVEELTLYLIAHEAEIKELAKEVKSLRVENEKLKKNK